jgi:hypothetical protein
MEETATATATAIMLTVVVVVVVAVITTEVGTEGMATSVGGREVGVVGMEAAARQEGNNLQEQEETLLQTLDL